MISMQYAKHLAHGSGLVWNIGEPPIEGFTNPLWTFLMAVAHMLPVPESKVALVVMLSSAVLLFANTVLVGYLAKQVAPKNSGVPLIAMILTLFCYPLVYWSLRGLEVAMVTTAVMACTILAVRASRSVQQRLIPLMVIWAGMSFAVATRLDAVIQTFIVIAYITITRPKLGMRLLALMILSVVVILTAQYLYFGDALPNTYYLKVGGISVQTRIHLGLDVFFQNALPVLTLPLVVCGLALALYADLRTKETALLGAMFLVQCCYSIWVGGDYAEPHVRTANRFIVQGLPFLFILSGVAGSRLVGMAFQKGQPSTSGALPAIAIALCLLIPLSGKQWETWLVNDAEMLDSDIWRAKRGLTIRECTSKDALIAVHAAGNIPYFADRRTLDLLGKSDRAIAHAPPKSLFRPGHNRWDYEYSIGQKQPDVVADEWGRLAIFMSTVMSNRYERMNSGMYIRNDSTKVDRGRLAGCE